MKEEAMVHSTALPHSHRRAAADRPRAPERTSLPILREIWERDAALAFDLPDREGDRIRGDEPDDQYLGSYYCG